MDPFDVLGVSESASEAEIASAFRAKAKLCHPDANKDPGAAERFTQLGQAREALLDPARRAQALKARQGRTGAGGRGWAPPSFTAEGRGKGATASAFDAFFDNIETNGRGREFRRERPVRGGNIEREAWITLEQSFRGGRVTLPNANGPCRACDATGRVPAPERRPCPGCAGRGWTRRVNGIVTGEMACPTCRTDGTVDYDTCPACGGTCQAQGAGVQIEVPAGARDGMRITREGLGTPGLHGGANGDLAVVVRIKDHPVFTRQDQHLSATVEVPVWDAALGTQARLTGIDGCGLLVKVPPGTSGGTVLVLEGQGMPAYPGRGELRVRVAVTVPDASSGPLRQAFEALRRAAGA